jgi:RHS repeat-associated protein
VSGCLRPNLLRQTAGSTTYYYHHDGLGSVADVTSSAGASLTWSEYYPYGMVRQGGTGSGAPAVQPFAFTGEQLDTVTGLYHLRARQYDPGIGRFLRLDPQAQPIADPYQSRYIYANDRPGIFVDPSGMASDEPPADNRQFPPCDLPQKAVGYGMEWVSGLYILDVLVDAAYALTPLPVKVVLVFVGGVGMLGGSQLSQLPCSGPPQP